MKIDSVQKELNSIDTANATNANKAYYKLLYAQYLYIVDKNYRDTTLLNDCIRFYDKRSDKEKLARSYYYKGELDFRCDEAQKAIFDKKYAEFLLNGTEFSNRQNTILYQKICEALAFYNIHFGENRMCLHYSKLSLKCLKLLNDRRYQAYALGMMSACYQQLNMTDSSNICIYKCEPLLPYTDKRCKGYIFGILANYYVGIDNKKAKQYLDSTFCYARDALTYLSAGNYYYATNNRKEAEKEWQEGLRSNGLHYVHSLIHKNLAQLYKDDGDINKCAFHLEMASKEDGHVYSTNNNVNINEAQLRANNKFFQKRLVGNITFWSCVALAIVAHTVALIYRKLRQARTTQKRQDHSLAAKAEELQDTTAKLTKAKEQISTLKREKAKMSDKIERLNTNITKAAQGAEDSMRRGKELFIGITEDGDTTAKWTANDYKQCLAYCKIEYAAAYAETERGYGNLPPRKLFIVLMCRIGHNYSAIGRMLGIHPDSVRKNIARIAGNSK